MPKRTKIKKSAETDPNGVRDFRHAEARRKNNPPAGVAPTYEVRERQTKNYTYDPHLDPQLKWAGKAEHTSFDVDVVSLHIHERISTRAVLGCNGSMVRYKSNSHDISDTFLGDTIALRADTTCTIQNWADKGLGVQEV